MSARWTRLEMRVVAFGNEFAINFQGLEKHPPRSKAIWRLISNNFYWHLFEREWPFAVFTLFNGQWVSPSNYWSRDPIVRTSALTLLLSQISIQLLIWEVLGTTTISQNFRSEDCFEATWDYFRNVCREGRLDFWRSSLHEQSDCYNLLTDLKEWLVVRRKSFHTRSWVCGAEWWLVHNSPCNNAYHDRTCWWLYQFLSNDGWSWRL